MSGKWLIISTVYALFISLAVGGCDSPPGDAAIITTPQQAVMQHYVIGTSVQNRPVECTVLGYGSDVILMLGAIHGDEPAGETLLQRLSVHLQDNPQLLEGKRVILVPVANPDGLANHRRLNANGVDLNRNFETDNRQNNSRFGYFGLSEPESRIITRIIRHYSPQRMVSIHQPSNCIDYDGPGQSLASYIAKYSNLPVRKLGSQPGSLGSYAGLVRGIPIITLELPPDADKLDTKSLWEKYGNILLAVITYPAKLK